MTTNTIASLATTVKEAAAAEAAALKATQDAKVARERAEVAKAEADRQRHQANERYLDLLQSRRVEDRTTALDAVTEARAAFERAVRGEDAGADVYATYRIWTAARIEAWRGERALADQLNYFGRAHREPADPRFDLAIDVAEVMNHFVIELQDAAIERNREERRAFLDGKTKS